MDAAVTAPSLTITRTITGSPEEVFQAWTNPEVMSSWWGPEGMTGAECNLDVRDGGHWRAIMRGPNGEHTTSGEYVRVDPPKELVFTWAWENDGVRGEETLVTVTFKPQGSNTALTLLHERFSKQETCDMHFEGWSSTLNKLEAKFA